MSPQLFIDKEKKANKQRMELHNCICYDDDDVISPSHPHTHISSAWKLAAGNNQIPNQDKAGQTGGFILSSLTYAQESTTRFLWLLWNSICRAL